MYVCFVKSKEWAFFKRILLFIKQILYVIKKESKMAVEWSKVLFKDDNNIGDVTGDSLTLSGLSASLPVFTDASKKLVSKSVADTLGTLGFVEYHSSDYASLAAFVTAISTTEAHLIINRDETVTADTVIPATVAVTVLKGCVITVATGVTLTISGPFLVGLYQVFSCTGTGKVVFGANTCGIRPEWWGAKGDGATDDSAAMRAANIAVMSTVHGSYAPTYGILSSYNKLVLTSGQYRVKGTKVFGSTLADDDTTYTKAYNYILEGNGASIIWDLDTANDVLFHFDHTIHAPVIHNISIFPIDSEEVIADGGVIFNFHSFTDTGTTYGESANADFERVYTYSGVSGSLTTKAEYVFKIVGPIMCHQGHVRNCEFGYFNTFLYSTNSNAVAWHFDTCGFFGGADPVDPSIYFSFTNMADSFNVKNCAFSLASGETLLLTNSEIVNDAYINEGLFNFNFTDNRMEQFNTAYASDTLTLCNMNFGHFNFSGTNLTLGESSALTSVVQLHGIASAHFSNIVFNPAEFYFPVNIAAGIGITARSYGARFDDCTFSARTYSYWNGSTAYAMKDVMIGSVDYYKPVIFNDCMEIGSHKMFSFNIADRNNIISYPIRTISYNMVGASPASTFVLPPYQTIKKVTVSVGLLPAALTYFRIYIGDPTLGEKIDVANPSPDSVSKEDLVLFEGNATVFNADLTKQSITVYLLDGPTEVYSARLYVTVTYTALDARLFGIIANTDVVKIQSKV
jgi:hypothetical protein